LGMFIANASLAGSLDNIQHFADVVNHEVQMICISPYHRLLTDQLLRYIYSKPQLRDRVHTHRFKSRSPIITSPIHTIRAPKVLNATTTPTSVAGTVTGTSVVQHITAS